MYFLGVDGGGTKTQIILADENENVIGVSFTGPTYIRSVFGDTLKKTLEEGIFFAIQNSHLKDVKIARSCFGIAGLDSPSDFAEVLKIVKSITSVRLDPHPLILNDAVCALRRGTNKGYGISIVAGTGSNCYARSKFGAETFVGGLGHTLSDEGGGYFVGLNVLHAASKSFDGRIEKTILEEMVYEEFGVLSMRDLLSKVYRDGFGKMEIARLSILCEEANEKGDAKAHEILQSAAKELVLMVKTGAKKLDMILDEFDLV